MSRLFDWLVEMWDRLRALFGFDRLTRKGRGDDLLDKGLLRRIGYFGRPALGLLALIYFGTMIWRFGWVRGEDLSYPQAVLTPERALPAGEATNPDTGTAESVTCAPSRIVEIEMALLDMMVNRNDWAPATPQYKAGVFFLLDWADTPWFDNKASFQLGMLGAVRTVSIELKNTLGRVRGTSQADPDLDAANGRLQVNERAWIFNPFDQALPTLATSAASSYRDARKLFGRFNERLSRCDALFDARADNLHQFLDRISKDLGSTVEQIARRSQGKAYDVATHRFVDGEGNDYGWFDFRADNFFHEARGRMYVYHGVLQAARLDFADVVEKRDLDDVWDRLEAHVAEAAVLKPLIVSNGSEDGLFMPDHLSVMAENILRARANMVELRDILAR